MVEVSIQQPEQSLVEQLNDRSAHGRDVILWWLGQAGFVIRYGGRTIFIDAYLSDHLAEKYEGTLFRHVRLMPAPIQAGEVQEVDWLLCTHGHSDHMDPGTVPVVMANNAGCMLVAPAAELKDIDDLGLDRRRTTLVDEGDNLRLTKDICVEPLASAHEQLESDNEGHNRYLGYVVRCGDISIYHSGDCVPYDGLAEKLIDKRIDVALLPVNGRDEYRANRNVPGNFTFDEATELVRRLKIPFMFCMHFGMFEFNTVEREWLWEQIHLCRAAARIIVPDIDSRYILSAQG